MKRLITFVASAGLFRSRDGSGICAAVGGSGLADVTDRPDSRTFADWGSHPLAT
jgi:hypothetical protein